MHLSQLLLVEYRLLYKGGVEACESAANEDAPAEEAEAPAEAPAEETAE